MTSRERAMAIDFHKKEMWKLVAECPHSFKPLSNKELKDEDFSDSAICISGCGQRFGWRCKESPDGVCHYLPFDDKHVKLLNGELVLISEETLEDAQDEHYECCLFCGQPEERK